jgi:hypothetical protein
MNELSTYVVAPESEIQPNGKYSLDRVLYSKFQHIRELPGTLEVRYNGTLANGEAIGGKVLIKSVDPLDAAQRARSTVIDEYPSLITITFDPPRRHEGVEREN